MRLPSLGAFATAARDIRASGTKGPLGHVVEGIEFCLPGYF